jgi:predicted nucleic acid-binding protein
MPRLRSRSFERRATPVDAVFDASALVRAVPRVGGDDAAVAWIEAALRRRVRAIVLELAFVESANALAVYAQTGRIADTDAAAALARILRYPFDVISMRTLVAAALDIGLRRDVSVYDACYLVAADAFDAVLVTADRRLARAATNSALLPKVGPPG